MDIYEDKLFQVEKIRQQTLFRNDAALAEIEAHSPDGPTLEKIRQIYGDICFPAAPADRPYTFSSIVVSVDGKIAFMDNPQGPLVANRNLRDPDGGIGDFWVLNMLRSFADAVVVGAKTMQTEPTMTAECFDRDLASKRVPVLGKKYECPPHVIISFDGTDVPFDHVVFDVPSPVLIATSPAGADYVRAHLKRPFTDLGRVADLADAGSAIERYGQSEKGLFLLATGAEATPHAPTLLGFLRRSGVTRLLVESPSFMTHLMSLKCMDEMFMNYSSTFVGGTIGFGAFQHFHSENHPHSDFLQINLHGRNFIYTRQQMRYEGYEIDE